MKRSYKTTIIGCILAGLMAAKPFLDGTGVHLDAKTLVELSFAVLIAAGGYYVKDADK